MIQKILRSETFKNKEVLKSVLKYLYDCNNRNKQITEQSIAEDVFKRTEFKGSDDTIVRVNLFKVRQALQKYYLHEGVNDAVRIEIPKGTYQMKFTESAEFTSSLNKKSKSYVFFIMGGLLLTSWLLILYLFQLNYGKESLKIWESYNNELPTRIILCPPHFQKYKHKESERVLVVREMGINTLEQEDSTTRALFPLHEFQHPKLEFSYFMPTNIYPLPTIIKSLYQSGVDEIELFSLNEFNNKELNNTIVVFVGSLKSMGYTADLLKNSSIQITHEPLGLILNDSTTFIPHNLPQDRFVDYALAVKLKGESNNSIMLLTSMYSTGITGITRKISNIDFTEQLASKYELPEQFELLVKVEGVNYSNLNFEIVHFKSLE